MDYVPIKKRVRVLVLRTNILSDAIWSVFLSKFHSSSNKKSVNKNIKTTLKKIEDESGFDSRVDINKKIKVKFSVVMHSRWLTYYLLMQFKYSKNKH
jgi:hypothetical protein